MRLLEVSKTRLHSGIDCEPDSHLEGLTEMRFENLWLQNNSGIGFEMELSNLVGSESPLTVTVAGVTAINNTGGGLFLRADAYLRGKISIEDVVVDGGSGASGHAHGLYLGNVFTVDAPRHGGLNPNGESGAALSLTNVTIRATPPGASPIFLARTWVPAHGCLMSPPSAFVGHPERRKFCAEGGAWGGVSLTGITVEDDAPRPFLNASMVCDFGHVALPPGSSCGVATIANMTGDITVKNRRTCAIKSTQNVVATTAHLGRRRAGS